MHVKITLLNIYTPNQYDYFIGFYIKISAILATYVGGFGIVADDFNCVLKPNLDKYLYIKYINI